MTDTKHMGPNWATADIRDGGTGVLVTDHVIRISKPWRYRIEVWDHHEDPPTDGVWHIVDRETDRRWPTEAAR